MISSIELVNWRSHKHNVLSFQKGVNVLIGIMGAGKSSVMDALSFGLFGTFPALVHRRTSLDGLILNKPNQENEAEVRVNFTSGDDAYTVTRKITREQGTTAKLEKNGAYVQAQPERVNEEIERLLNVDYDTFSRVVYSEQNQLDYFLELPKGDRKRQIDQMLGLDRFANAEVNATSLINSMKSLITGEEQTLTQMDLGEFKRQLESLSKEKEMIGKEQAALAKEATLAKGGMEKRKNELSELRQRYEKRVKLVKEIAELESRILTLGKEIEKTVVPHGLDRLESDRKEIGEKERSAITELKNLKAKGDAATREAAQADADLKGCLAKTKERDRILDGMKGKDLPAIEGTIKKDDDALQELRKDLAVLKGRKQELEDSVDELSKDISKCPVCERELDDDLRHKLLKDKVARSAEVLSALERSSKSIAELAERIENATKERNALLLSSKKLEDYKDIEELAKKAGEWAESSKRASLALYKDIEKSDAELETIRKAIKALDTDLEAAKRKLNHELEVKKDLELLSARKGELTSIKVDEKALYELQDMITKESSRLSEVTSKLESGKRYLANVDAQIDDKAKQIANMNQIKERVEKRRQQVGEMNKFKGALVDTEGLLRNRLITSINSMMQGIWSEIYPYADYTGIRLDAGRDDYRLEARTSNGEEAKWSEVDGMASGGERSMACLAMRIAFAMVVVPNLKWLILDEPTHNIDENGITRFVEMLGDSLPRVVEQVFVITHESELKQVNAARIYQLERDKDRNGYTKIAES